MKTEDPTVPDILKKLARSLGAEIKDRKLEIPPQSGSGYCTGFVFNKNIRMMISNYELYEDISLENSDREEGKRMVFFKFQNIFSQPEIRSAAKSVREMPSVLMATSRLNTDEVITIHSNTGTINIEADADYLNGLFHAPDQSPVLKSLLENSQPYLFEQLIDPSLQGIVSEILSEPVDEAFKLFFMRVKAEELVCRLLMTLEKRDEKRLYSLNAQDVETIYKIREKMLEHLEIPPLIGNLAAEAGMSPTKLKRLFKQIFGNSLFSYYQEFRMKEAAFLLEANKYSVSEVGYKLGFTNLSHFAKIFKEHTGINPKKYTMLDFKENK
ncbi:helix-turn-helix transcriptional regulator [Chryseobacterium kwangjuense]|uniref:Helix-turn-helix transcriptional regulator n=1 Tax=Chryseobacterium kwangjuense TaxID=267125 RepID=A0ABW9K617_9FLAO